MPPPCGRPPGVAISRALADRSAWSAPGTSPSKGRSASARRRSPRSWRSGWAARLVLEAVEENPFLARASTPTGRSTRSRRSSSSCSRASSSSRRSSSRTSSASRRSSDYLFAKDRIFAALDARPRRARALRAGLRAARPAGGEARPGRLPAGRARGAAAAHQAARARLRARRWTRRYVETLAKAYSDFFFHYDETPLLVVNTSDIDLEGSPADVEALLGVIRRHRKGTQHYVPLGTRNVLIDLTPSPTGGTPRGPTPEEVDMSVQTAPRRSTSPSTS